MTIQRLRAQDAATNILVVGLLLLGPLLFLQSIWLAEEVERAELIAQISRVSRDLAQGHLWFEERLFGDESETDEKWQALFASARLAAQQYRKGLEEFDASILQREQSILLASGEEEAAPETRSGSEWLVQIEGGISAMERIAFDRLDRGSTAGSTLDVKFDEINAEIDQITATILEDWRALSASQNRERLRVHRSALFLWFACLLGFVLLLWFLSRRRRVAEEEQRRLEARFQQAQKLESLGVLAGGIAHDFNNLLMGVLGTVSLSQLEENIPDSVKTHLEDIERSARKSADLTSQLLAYAGKGKFTEERIDLEGMVDDLEDLLRVSLGSNAEVVHEFDDEIPAVEGNPTQLQQVIMNLLINASDAMGEKGGRITLRLRSGNFSTEDLVRDSQGLEDPPPGEYLHLEVEDEGPGMDAVALARCFEPFFTTKFTGRGLGLAAVVGIVRAHQGVIRVTSEPSQGARFSIFLPAAGKRVQRPANAPAATAIEPGTGRLLVIDDDQAVRLLVERMLIKCGYEVELAASGELGVARFRQRPREFRAVLVDMEMPGLSGVETGDALRGIDAEVPVILTSGYSEDLLREDDGFAGFIQKPYRIEELSTRLAQILAVDGPSPGD